MNKELRTLNESSGIYVRCNVCNFVSGPHHDSQRALIAGKIHEAFWMIDNFLTHKTYFVNLEKTVELKLKGIEYCPECLELVKHFHRCPAKD